MIDYLIAVDFDGVLIPDSRRPYRVAPDDLDAVAGLFNPDAVANVRDLASGFDARLAITSSWLRGRDDREFFRSLFDRLGLREPIVPRFDLDLGGYDDVVSWFEGAGVRPDRLLWIEDGWVSPNDDNARWVARQYRPRFGAFTAFDREMARKHMQLSTGDGRFILKYQKEF